MEKSRPLAMPVGVLRFGARSLSSEIASQDLVVAALRE
jgi:hypothetical protein